MSINKNPPAGHIPVPYPTLTQGFDSLQHLAADLLGTGNEGQNVMIAQGWVGLGTGLSQVFPPGMTAQKQAIALTAEERATLETFSGMRSAPEGFDWGAAIKLILTILLRLAG